MKYCNISQYRFHSRYPPLTIVHLSLLLMCTKRFHENINFQFHMGWVEPNCKCKQNHNYFEKHVETIIYFLHQITVATPLCPFLHVHNSKFQIVVHVTNSPTLILDIFKLRSMGAPLHDITVCKSNQKIKFYITKIFKGYFEGWNYGHEYSKRDLKNIKCRKFSNLLEH